VPVEQLHGHRWGQAVRAAVILAWFVAMYVPLVRWMAPQAWRALLARLAGLYKARGAAELEAGATTVAVG